MTPVEWGLLISSAAMAGAGAYTEYQAANKAADESEKWAEYNAAVSEKEGEEVAQRTAFEVRRAREEAERRRASQQTLLAQTGFLSTEGSPLLALQESAANEELDIAIMEREGAMQSQGAFNQAEIQRMQGREQASAYRAQGRASLLSGVGQIAGMGLDASLAGRGRSQRMGEITYKKKMNSTLK